MCKSLSKFTHGDFVTFPTYQTRSTYLQMSYPFTGTVIQITQHLYFTVIFFYKLHLSRVSIHPNVTTGFDLRHLCEKADKK